MFVGSYKIIINEHWEMRLPDFILGKFDGGKVLMRLGKNDVLEIHKADKVISKKEAPYWFLVKIKNKKIKIPQPLRNSTSFFFGKKVVLVGKGNFLYLYPKP